MGDPATPTTASCQDCALGHSRSSPSSIEGRHDHRVSTALLVQHLQQLRSRSPSRSSAAAFDQPHQPQRARIPAELSPHASERNVAVLVAVARRCCPLYEPTRPRAHCRRPKPASTPAELRAAARHVLLPASASTTTTYLHTVVPYPPTRSSTQAYHVQPTWGNANTWTALLEPSA